MQIKNAEILVYFKKKQYLCRGKGFERSKQDKYKNGYTMLHSNFQFAIILAMLLLAVGCKNEDPFVDPGDVVDPEWTVPAGSDITASMTAIVDVTFAKTQGTLAAFVGDECCGVTRESDFVDSLYYILITAPKAEGNVQLRFYSPALKRIFLANETFPFVNDSHIGSAKPYTPTWKVAE